MFYENQTNHTRPIFFDSWSKYNQKKPLSALEQQIVAVILDHPEYHVFFNQKPEHLDHQYFPELGETNPFLHLGLHLAIREQVATNRPAGIKDVFQKICEIKKTSIEAEHAMMECLAESLWQAQRDGIMPDETKYLQLCKLLINS